MTTKQRIINEAIQAYNSYGMSNITSRDIAKLLQMSHGNIEYHFPNKEVLLLSIYDQMRLEISNFYELKDQSDLHPIKQFHDLLIGLENFQEKYSFFNLDILEISRNHPRVNEQIQDTLRTRNVQIANFFQKFLNLNYIKPEPTKGSYERLQHSIRILLTFWKSKEIVLASFNVTEKVTMTQLIWDQITPHFTAKGITQYIDVLNKEANQNHIS